MTKSFNLKPYMDRLIACKENGIPLLYGLYYLSLMTH